MLACRCFGNSIFKTGSREKKDIGGFFMAKVKRLPQRTEVAQELTWDLSQVFSDDVAFEESFDTVKQKAIDFTAYKGTLANGAKQFLTALEALLALERELEKVYVYASMKNDQDTSETKYQAMMAKVQKLVAEASAKNAWFQPELLALTPAKLAAYYEAEPKLAEYQTLITNWTRLRAHVLSETEEALLAGASDILSTASNIFEVLNNADLKFPVVTNEKGEAVELSNGVYGTLLESTAPEVRKEAFEKLYQVYHQFRHTLATTLAAHVRKHNFSAKLRHYSSAKEASLAQNEIPVTVYDTLVTTVNKNLPLLHRYVALRKKILATKELHMYDLYTPLTGEPALTFTYEQAKQMTLEALRVLGPDYVAQVEKAFDKRWIDVVANTGKRSGAYSGGSYDTPPYILLNWQDTLDNLFTLVHELGHSMHSYYTRTEQPYQYGDYSIFVAEIASTTNENLLTQYLLETQTDPNIRAYVLNHYLDGFKGTVYRQTQFAEFEEWIHQQDAAQVPLTAEAMSSYYHALNARYYGPAVVNDEQIADEWARIPHFYYNFYVYQYATGFGAATTLSKRLLENDPAKTKTYLDYLKAGSSAAPLEVMKKAGVDMTDSVYLEKAFTVFEKRLVELEQLLG